MRRSGGPPAPASHVTAPTQHVAIRWHLHKVVDARGLRAGDLHPLLAEFGIKKCKTQVYRLVRNTPERLSMDLLAALCAILDCTVDALIEIDGAPAPARRRIPAAVLRHKLSPVRVKLREPFPAP